MAGASALGRVWNDKDSGGDDAAGPAHGDGRAGEGDGSSASFSFMDPWIAVWLCVAADMMCLYLGCHISGGQWR